MPVLRVGGPQGSGVDTLAQLLAIALLKAGYEVLGRREYHSNIMGRHSYLDVAYGTTRPRAFEGPADAMLALDAESVVRHLGWLHPSARLFYPAGIEDTAIATLPFLDSRPKEALLARLGPEARIHDALEAHRQHGVEVTPYTAKGQGKSRNLSALATFYQALGLPPAALFAAVEARFSHRPAALRANLEALRDVLPAPHEPAPPRGDRLFLTGAQAAALGKVAGGLELQSYYPISPATDESTYLEAHPKAGVQVVQLEDELAAIHFAIGAALGGRRAATATSGPGFSLMAEALGFAGIAEVPLVVTLYMRGGPSTGLPTRTEQGDLLFSLFAGHGEFPRVVLASGDLEEAFADAARALALAWRLELPVIHLLDKEIASSFAGLEARALKPPAAEPPVANEERAVPYPRFERAFLPLGSPETHYWITSDEHDALGHITEDPVLRRRMMDRRQAKLKRLEEKASFQLYGDAGPLLVGFGSLKGAAIEATKRLGWRYLHLRRLWPFPASAARLLREGFAVVEQNQTGQLEGLIRMATGLSPRFSLQKYTGRPIFVDELTRALEAETDAVLMEGV